MFWPWEVVERDHEIQNPTSPEKIRLLGDYLRLGAESRVLDLACGKGGPALVLATTFGCRILGVEERLAFAEEARARVAAVGLESRVEVETGDASTFPIERETWDAALCLGASFVWGHIGDAAAALVEAVKPGGYVAVGEPYWREWPLPERVEPDAFASLEDTVARFETSGVAVTGIIAASEDDWDRYESLHWRAIEEWLAGHGDHPHAEDFRTRHNRFREDYFRFAWALLGWAIFVGRKRR